MVQLRALLTAGLVGAALLACTLSSGPVLAAIVRQPETGAPAFVVDTPPGVSVERDGGNVFLTLDGHAAGLMLSMDRTSDLDNHSLTDLAAIVLRAANAEPASRQEAAWVDGVAGERFYSRMNNNGAVTVHLRLFLAKVEGTHFASLAMMYANDLAPEQLSRLEALADSVKITRGRGGLTTISFPAPAPKNPGGPA